MRKSACRQALGLILFLFSLLFADAQGTGVINRPATSAAGRAVLDPNGNGYTSITTTGFGSDDVANSEIPYKPIRAFSVEPFGDLRRGPNHQFSDFVPDAANNGVYSYYDGTNLLFRFRMGSVMSGSKGYSILVDTDGRFGATGANADPNYQAATTGTNGNPGFEIEIVLETNFRVAIYNVDGTSNPTMVTQYTAWQEYSQVSIAGTNDNGDPDFYMDFYVPFSALTAAPFNLTTSSALRFSATTVMAPKAAIGGPKSDIYGLNDALYKSTNDQWEAYINAQPPVTMTNLGSGGTGMGGMCTAAPTVNSPVGVGTVSISGTWTMSNLTNAVNTATITVYRNGTAVGTVAGVGSGSTWTLANVTTVAGDVITARAQATGESLCLLSNAVTAASCNASNTPPQPVLDCYSTSKGITGTNRSGAWTVYIDNLTRNTSENSVANTGGFFSGVTGTNWLYSGGCTSGAPMTSGSYKVYYLNTASGCVSVPAYVCVAGNGGNALAGTVATPTITAPAGSVFTTATKTVSGTTDAGATVSLYVNGAVLQTTTATGGNFSFTGLTLAAGQTVQVTAELNTTIVSTSKCAAQSALFTVTCFTTPPVITADAANRIAAGAFISGTSGEPTGALIRVYNAANTLLATTPVQANGTWSTGNAGTTPATLTAVASTVYYATAQNGSCGVSAASANVTAVAATAARCGTITGPVGAAAASVSGTVTGSVAGTTVNLYLDGELIGSTTTGTTAWSVPVNVGGNPTSQLYANGVLTIGIAESGRTELLCPASATIGCSPAPVSPTIVSPTNPTIAPNQSITYTLSNITTGTFYGIADANTGRSLALGIWAPSTSNLSITTYPFSSAGSYNIQVRASSVSGVNVCRAVPAASAVTVSSSPLPVRFVALAADRNTGGASVRWTVTAERNVAYYIVERSTDCNRFEEAGRVAFRASVGTENTYTFQDAAAPAGKVCYRLREVAADGRVQYSGVVSLRGSDGPLLQVAPNPATTAATAQVTLGQAGTATLALVNAYGSAVWTRTLQLPKGTSALRLDGLEQFARGHYLLRATGPDGTTHQKLVLQ